MSPEELDRVCAVARERHRAMTPADHRRERRAGRREYRAERLARWRAWWRRPAPEDIADAAASLSVTIDPYV